VQRGRRWLWLGWLVGWLVGSLVGKGVGAEGKGVGVGCGGCWELLRGGGEKGQGSDVVMEFVSAEPTQR
jgi:hypothetical protein